MIDIKQESYFPPQFRFFGFILIFGAIIYLFLDGFSYIKLLISLPVTALGFLLLLLRYGFQIDVKNKHYRIYTWFPGIKKGNWNRYEQIDKIYINDVTESSVFTTRGGTTHDINKKMYKAFILFNTGDKVHLDTDKDHNRLNRRIRIFEEKISFKH